MEIPVVAPVLAAPSVTTGIDAGQKADIVMQGQEVEAPKELSRDEKIDKMLI